MTKTQVVVAVLAGVAGEAWAVDATVPVLGRDGDRLVVETLTIADGQTQVIAYGPGGALGVVIPEGPGISGDIKQAGQVKAMIVRNDGESLSRTAMMGDGSRRELPAVAIETLDDYDVRVSVTTADGPLGAFVIPGGGEARVDGVLGATDMFRGAVPLGPSDVSMTTEVYAVPTQRVAGTFDLVVRDGRLRVVGDIDGKKVDLIIDTGGGSSLVLVRGAVPEGVEVREATMTRSSGGGVETLPMVVGGARGSVDVGGAATIESLSVGGVVFEDVSAMVVDGAAAEVISEKLDADGILGMSLLQRGGVVEFDLAGGTVTLGAETFEGGAEFSHAMSHMVLGADAGGAHIPMVLDTGAPMVFFTGSAAEKLGVEIGTGEAVEASGLEGDTTTFEAGLAPELSVAGVRVEDVPVRVGDLPGITRYGEDVGLVGVEFLERFGRVRIDFGRMRILLGTGDG